MTDFQVREGVIYLTRDGETTGAMRAQRSFQGQPWYDPRHQRYYNDNGRWYQNGDESENDLVAVWTEAAPGEPIMPPNAPTEAEMIARLPRMVFCDCMQGPNDPDPKCPDCRGTGTPGFDIKAHIADTAKSIVSGARRSAYGTPEQNFERISRLWNGYLVNAGILDVSVMGDPEAKGGITPGDVSLMMALLKIARLGETPDHYDSFVDLVGYALTGAEVNKVEKPA